MVKISIIEAKFNRGRGNFENTYLWKELNEQQKRSFYKFSLNEHEHIIISSFIPTYLLTNLRVICNDYSIFYSEIKSVRIFDVEAIKGNISKLEFITNDCQTLFLELEKQTWMVIYNIIRLLIKQTT
ncbi:MAG: hypothetical protein MUF45_00485 [Spirosomaceae bacterium]|jgi:hypothetical protein|nr:hypothetical protein [Spirosomataceae bacterium]